MNAYKVKGCTHEHRRFTATALAASWSDAVRQIAKVLGKIPANIMVRKV